MINKCTHFSSSLAVFLYFSLPENLFGNYMDKGSFIEKVGLPAAVEPDSIPTNTNRYMVADVTSFFTMLVGIYFPSVTGRGFSHPSFMIVKLPLCIRILYALKIKGRFSQRYRKRTIFPRTLSFWNHLLNIKNIFIFLNPLWIHFFLQSKS